MKEPKEIVIPVAKLNRQKVADLIAKFCMRIPTSKKDHIDSNLLKLSILYITLAKKESPKAVDRALKAIEKELK